MAVKDRGPYETGEARVPLLDRANGPWTAMEREVFNAVTKHWDRSGERPLFSRRLLVVQEMLFLFDALVDSRVEL